MFTKFRNSFLAAVIAFTSAVPVQSAGMVGENGTYYFRYKNPIEQVRLPDPENKDVTAFYTGGVGFDFSELLPLKPQWQDDTWRVLPGSTLPAGITFNSGTRKFEGKPTAAGLDTVVQLEGVDVLGNTVAKAEVHFDIYTIQGVPVHGDLYAHTDKFKVDEMKIPAGVVIDSWQHIYPLPSGISASGPFIQGTPTAAGQKRYMLFGKNYMGEVVATYWGNYIVEDGPTFNRPVDWTDIRDLPVNSGLQFTINVPASIHVEHAINPAKAVRYYLEIDPTDGLPTGVALNDVTANGFTLSGLVNGAFDTGKIRVKAIDSDATVGYSGWFTFGTGQPQLSCGTGPIPVFDLKTGKAVSMSPPRPVNSSGSVAFSLVSGALPDGLRLTNNLIVGTPTTANQEKTVNIAATVTLNGQTGDPQPCAMTFRTRPGDLALSDATGQQERHVRVGETYEGIAQVEGGQNPFEVKAANGSLPAGFAFTTPTADTAQVGVSGTVAADGMGTIPLTLSNGDGNDVAGQLSYIGHGPLSTGIVPTIAVQRLGPNKVWGSVPYDVTSIIPDVTGARDFPEFTISNPSGLPNGISVSGGDFTGATAAPAKSYGTYTVTMTDFEGKPVTSNAFELVVTPRDEIGIETLVEPRFTVRWSQQKAIPLVVRQPDGAKRFRVDYVLNNESPDPQPNWLSFDTTTGEMTAAQIPYADMRDWGPYTITATDEEGSTVTTNQFHVHVADWPSPSSLVSTSFRGTVSGNTSIGETATWLNIPGTAAANLRAFVLRNTVIGGSEKVVFKGSNPAKPAGLDFNLAEGTFSGVPTSEFNGTVEVAFVDEEGREGTMDVPLEVRAYPSVKTTQADYEIPRLANAALIPVPLKGEAVSGLWNDPVWTVDTSRGPDLPLGLTLNRNTGLVEGRATVAEGSVVSGVVFKATSTGGAGERLESWTPPFSIKITKPAPITLSYSQSNVTYYLVKDAHGVYSMSQGNPTTSPSPVLGGSYETPLTYSIDLSDAIANGMTGTLGINKDNGRITGSPDRLGEWQVKVNVKDGTQLSPAQPATLTVKATLDGYVEHTNGDNTLVLRQDERFKTDVIDVSNYVGNVVFSTNPSIVNDGLFIDTDSGAMLPTSSFAAPVNNYSFSIGVRDADGRGFKENPKQEFQVIGPMTASGATPDFSAKQFSSAADGGIDVSWAISTTNVIKAVRYSISGDLPGTLVYKTYDDNEAFLGWSWKDDAGDTQWVAANTQNAADRLPYDALVFDTLHPSLVGSPSKSGTFSDLRIVATDLHQGDYKVPSPNQSEYNSASLGPFSITVEAAAPFSASVSAADETIYRYTSVPTLRVTAMNAAAGKPVTWTLSGTLPDGIAEVKGDAYASFGGYATEKGTFPGLVWRAKDAAGRTATAPAITLVVEERKGLELSANPAPFGVVAGTPLPAFAVNALNSAYGKTIPASDWVLPTSGMPSGLTMSVANGRALLSGTTSAVGDYTALVSATDSLGSAANTHVAISVLDEDEKIEVSSNSGRTKKGFPAELQITATSRTFGDIGYSSSDPALSVDATGKVTAIYATSGHMNPVVTVSDSTRRTTDRTLSIDVIETLQIEVPTVYVEAGKERITQVAATNVLGSVTYSKGSGTWPAGLIVDPATGEIRGVVDEAKGSTFTGLTVRGDDTFTVAGTVYHDIRESNVFDVVVDGTPTGFALRTPASPDTVAAVIVNNVIDDFAVSPVNQAWNLTIPQSKWSVNTTAAALPPGVTFAYSNGNIVATGTPTALGTYGPYTFTATDGLGQTATATVSIRVITPEDAIVLNVSDVTTKVGLPINMQPSATNTYGKVTFYSYAIDGDPQTHVPGEFKSNLAIDPAAGLVTGSFPAIGDRTFDVYVSDWTKRVTSKPVKVSVLPNLRIVVPDVVAADPYENLNRTVDTAYALGTVSYVKGAGDWPEGFTVDATTGAIKATAPLTSGLGTFAGLTIRATDTFATGTETRDSNVFSIKVEATGPYIRMLPNTQVQMTNAQKRVAYTFDATTLAEFQNAGATDFNFTWEAASSTLPANLSMNAAGLVTGTPKNSGTYQIKITGTNKTNSKITSSAVYTLVIDLPPLKLNIVGNPTDATRTEPYSFNLSSILELQNIPTSGLVYTWSVKNANQKLPPNMTLSNGVISGTSREPGVFEFHLKVEFTENNAVAEYMSAEGDITLKVTTPPTSGFTDISSGMNHVCAIRKGEVWCWGAGAGGQLGNGLNANSNVPVRAGTIDNAVVVAAGVDASYAVTSSGQLWTWGNNAYGQLGTGNTTARNTPGLVMSSGVTYVIANRANPAPGGGSACAVKDGEGYCWGTGSYGQLGTGAAANTPTPTKLAGQIGSGIVSMNMEYIQSYAVKSDGTLWAWGWNGENRLCGGTQNQVIATPRLVTQATGQYAAKYATGYIQYQTVNNALVSCQSGISTILTGVKYASANYSAMQDGTVASNSNGVRVADASNVVKVTGGASAHCGIDIYGEAMCWGTGSSGQLGNGSNGSSASAVFIKRMW